jgi:CBS domain-containing protein
MALAIPVSAPSAVRALIEYQALVNALILVFNLLPAFPLDGGRVLRSVLWRRSGDLARATETAATVGRGFGYVMIALGGLELLGGFPAGAWLAIVGVFVVMAAGAQAAGAQVQAAFAGIPAREVMTSPAVGIPATVALSRAGEDYFMHYRYTSFPVLDGEGRALGLVSGPQLEALAHGGAGTGRRSMGELADRDPGLIVNEGEDVARLLERPAFARVGRAVVVDQVRRPVGVISVTDVQRTLRARRVAESAGSPR